MKLKSLLSISSVFMLLAILVSSCGSTLNIAKKRHSNGYYVNIGSDHHDGERKTDTRKSRKRSLTKLVEDKIDEDNLANSLKGSENVDGVNPNKASNLTSENLSAEQLTAAEEFSKMSTLKKIKTLKNLNTDSKLDDNSDFMFILLVLLSLILPPLAVYIHGDGIGTHFWINLVMWVLGVGAFGLFAGGAYAAIGILLLVAVIHALLYVFNIIS